MAVGEDVPRIKMFLRELTRPQRSERVPGRRAPTAVRAFVRPPWKRVVLWLMLLLGLAVQLIVVALVYQLVDLSISLMELWAELARKHLEIILT